MPKCMTKSKSKETRAQREKTAEGYDDDHVLAMYFSQRNNYSDPTASAAQRRWNQIIRREARKRGLI